jgi:hypothetical protein
MDYTGRLSRRMQELRWNPSDPLYVQALRIVAHYTACGLGGAGYPGPPSTSPGEVR